MRTSESIKNIAAALHKAQGAIDGVVKDGMNPHFKSKYATLEACWHAVKDHLQAAGLVLTQIPSMDDQYRPVLVTRIMETESGEWIEGTYPLNPTKTDPQGYGSAITYARRYALSAMLGLCSEEDDDGNAASKPGGNGRSGKAHPNGDANAPRIQMARFAKDWSGLDGDEIPQACKDIMRASGQEPNDNGDWTDRQITQALVWAKNQRQNGIEFFDATKRKEESWV